MSSFDDYYGADAPMMKERFRALFELCLDELSDLPDDHLVWPTEFIARLNDRVELPADHPLRSKVQEDGPSMAGELRAQLKQCLLDLDHGPGVSLTVLDGERRLR